MHLTYLYIYEYKLIFKMLEIRIFLPFYQNNLETTHVKPDFTSNYND